jgi:hypothetical protein
MDEIKLFTSLKPDVPGDMEFSQMGAGARRQVVAAIRRRGRKWQMPMLAGGLTALVAGAAAAVVVLTSGGTPAPAPARQHYGTVVTAAWTVKENTDGTVTVEIRQFADPARLQQVLRDDGINAFVRETHLVSKKVGKTTYTYLSCTYPYAAPNDAPQSVQHEVVTPDFPQGWIIHPAAMPPGSALFLSGTPPMRGGLEEASYPQVLTNDQLPFCKPAKPPAGA